MSIFRRLTANPMPQFIRPAQGARPELDEQQRAGRALLWDKQVNRKIWGDYRDTQVAQKPYPYQTNAD